MCACGVAAPIYRGRGNAAGSRHSKQAVATTHCSCYCSCGRAHSHWSPCIISDFSVCTKQTLLFAQHASSRDQLLLVEIQVVQVQILGVQVRHIREPTRRRLWRWRWRWRLRRRWWRRPCLVGSRGKLLRLHGKPHQRWRFLHTHTYPHRQHHATSRSATLFPRRTLRSKSWPYIWSSRALATTACDGPYVVSAAATSASRSCWKAS